MLEQAAYVSIAVGGLVLIGTALIAIVAVIWGFSMWVWEKLGL